MTLKEFADAIRLHVYAQRMEPVSSTLQPVPWEMLKDSERIQWEQVATAAQEVLGDG